MKREDVPVPSPCDNTPYEKALDERRGRHCASCDQEVHNLSAMSRDEAEALMESGDDLCVHYLYRKDTGEVLFRDSELLKQSRKTVQLKSQRQGLRRLLKAAAVAVPLLVAGCDDPSSDGEAEAVAASGEDDAVASGTPDEDGESGAASAPEPEVDMEEAADEIAARIDAQSRKIAEKTEEDEGEAGLISASEAFEGADDIASTTDGDDTGEYLIGGGEVGAVDGGMVIDDEIDDEIEPDIVQSNIDSQEIDVRDGSIDEEQLARALHRTKHSFVGSYENYLRQNPNAQGVVKFEIGVATRGPRGTIDSAEVLRDDVAVDDSVGEQIAAELERTQTRLPSPEDGDAIVEFTLTFSSG